MVSASNTNWGKIALWMAAMPWLFLALCFVGGGSSVAFLVFVETIMCLTLLSALVLGVLGLFKDKNKSRATLAVCIAVLFAIVLAWLCTIAVGISRTF